MNISEELLQHSGIAVAQDDDKMALQRSALGQLEKIGSAAHFTIPIGQQRSCDVWFPVQAGGSPSKPGSVGSSPASSGSSNASLPPGKSEKAAALMPTPISRKRPLHSLVSDANQQRSKLVGSDEERRLRVQIRAKKSHLEELQRKNIMHEKSCNKEEVAKLERLIKKWTEVSRQLLMDMKEHSKKMLPDGLTIRALIERFGLDPKALDFHSDDDDFSGWDGKSLQQLRVESGENVSGSSTITLQPDAFSRDMPDEFFEKTAANTADEKIEGVLWKRASNLLQDT